MPEQSPDRTVALRAPMLRNRRPMLLRLVGTTIAIFGGLAMSSAHAASPVPQPPIDLGETSFLDGEAGPGGLFEVIGNGYVASQFTDASGRRVAGTNRQSIGSVIFHFAYVSNLSLAGGVLGAETLIPFAALHLDMPGVPNPSYSPHSRDSLTAMVQTSGIA